MNKSKEKKINVNIFGNKRRAIFNGNIKSSNLNDKNNYDFGPDTNSVVKNKNQNIRNTIE